MFALIRIILLGSRLVLASVVALMAQIYLLINRADDLLLVQRQINTWVERIFVELNVDSRYQVAYNLIGGDNLLVHTAFVLLVYLLILIVLLPFKRKKRIPYRY